MVVVVVFQSLMTTRAWASDQKLLMLRHSSRTRELNDFDVAVAPGLSGWDEVQADVLTGPFAIAAQANSGPLSQRNTAG